MMLRNLLLKLACFMVALCNRETIYIWDGLMYVSVLYCINRAIISCLVSKCCYILRES